MSNNSILQHGGAGIADGNGAKDNVYENNRADGDTPWRISSPTARLQNNIPPTGVHRDVSAAEGSDTVRVDFAKPYARRPWLTFGRTGGGVRDVTFETDGNGHFVGATIALARPKASIDVRVDDL